jgi:hypothetical protein
VGCEAEAPRGIAAAPGPEEKREGKGNAMKLPAWLDAMRTTVPAWLARVRHASGPGRYRFALDAYQPYDLDSSCMAENIVGVLHGLPAAAERRAWCDYLCSLQRPEDGLLIDPGMERHIITNHAKPTEEEVFNVRRWTSRNGLVTVLELGGVPRYRLAHKECFRTRAETEAYLDGLNWKGPWGAGSWAGATVWFHHLNRLLGDESADVVVQAAVDWLLRRQDPQTGAWSDGSPDIPLHQLINGIFKVWIQAIPCAHLPVQYPERVVDLCIRGLREDPVLTGTPDACSIFDVALVLDTALRSCDHRRDEVAGLMAACLPRFEPMVRSDGAFSYSPTGSLASHGGLSLAPVKDQSDITGTAINCSAIALVCNLCGLRNELGWTPTTEARMGLGRIA